MSPDGNIDHFPTSPASLHCHAMSLLRAVPPLVSIVAKLTADGRFVDLDRFIYLTLVVTCLHQRFDRVSFLAGELRVRH
jgi:hypothetical protein